jgi:long-chain acyl-CoA synthetase
MDELADWAKQFGAKIAAKIVGTRAEIDYATLDRNSNRAAQILLEHGLKSGDTVALMLPNCIESLELLWAARRLGLYYTPISTHLRDAEAAYILNDCGAQVFFAPPEIPPLAFGGVRYSLGGDGDRAAAPSYVARRDAFTRYVQLPTGPLGKDFAYSSGTTGRPKGVKRKLYPDPRIERQLTDWIQNFSQHDTASVCLIGAPLYHAAPLRFAMRSIAHGGTVHMMRKFDAVEALKTIDQFKVTHSLWVPTMFYRMLALPEPIRGSYDVSSLKLALHSGGPCAPALKRRMIDWFGPVVWEYYGGSEGNGATCISPEEALMHPGSVGKAVLGKLHILGAAGEEVPIGATGEIYFEGGPEFVYHNDPEKTQQARNAQGWTTIGDIGHVDAEGYLYLSDRKAHTIVSGGVNIYPAEIEHVLRDHPAVADAAVFGIPNEEFGEEVKAVVELQPGVAASPELGLELLRHCRENLASLKCPKSVSFEASLPRHDNGKLYKTELKRTYSRISHPTTRQG